ncbi:metalloregulator ArsR/SmtB family transcription factor [Asanoa sp. WMMD1127]|uniref:ArsR/SmtB family transcription factor n=1 Tax=Asanoa sp. WMMD1127 TaxID=3016107 RepID=UPI0024163200|nr:metalloregulator ArsR/SmtB family transcription factor [Asanoa sp. WMMD1127]MDG4820839.1 metalloregulator ArsR/SmtB family transcription factor [Asanoa sp. WMMD1127]
MVREPLSEAGAADLAKAFKALGDPVRLRLLSMIAARAGGEICVCDLTDAFQVKGPTISHHLRVLREAGLIDCERRGTWVYYWVIPSALAPLSQLLDISALADEGDAPAFVAESVGHLDAAGARQR